MKTIVSASILSADLCDLKTELIRTEKSGADYVHFDVMDGVFVNNISYGIPVLKCVRKATDMFL
ncbi:MAG: ribulose-phosphate 3-epimerase, partial [Oscillospiraceae bacterium]